MQKGIFVMLVIIAFLLGANLFKGNEVQAAKVYTYKIHKVSLDYVEETLNEESQKGYEYVGISPGILIFRK